MTTSTVPSAYPFDVTELLPRARALAESLDEIPSRNRLMKEFKVGAPKATALREALQHVALTVTAPAAPSLPAPAPDPSADPSADPGATATPEGPATTIGPPPPDVVPDRSPLAGGDGHPDTNITPGPPAPAPPAPAPVRAPVRRPVAWPVLLLALPAFVAIWSGWVELGELAGFGVVQPLPGIADNVRLNTAITLPIGVETYAAYALWVWLSGRAPAPARRFAKWSAIGSLAFGAAGQIAYHLMAAAGLTSAPWLITAAVSCLPVAVLGMGAALAHLLHTEPAS